MRNHIKGVFFDLDGTLLDTAPDLALACNDVLAQHNRPPVALAQFRNWVHGGALMMISQSFGINADHPDYSAIKSAFLASYQQRLTHSTQIFSGVPELLDYLDREAIPWGVITNKYACLAEPLLAHFGLVQRCCCLVSGDTLAVAKPNPAPLLHACQLTGINPSHSIYIGDTLGDIQAARAAGMHSIAVSYGYLPADSNPVEWRADALAATSYDILCILKHWKE
jgi:N-acetyl-D-muramate 6-phosphate phosphatase